MAMHLRFVKLETLLNDAFNVDITNAQGVALVKGVILFRANRSVRRITYCLKNFKPHCTTYSYLRPLYSKQCLIGDH